MAATVEIKDHLKAAAVRLQRAQSKLEAISRTAHREISSLLHQESRSRLIQPDAAQATLATVRQKAEKLLAEDIAGEIMAILEHYCDILLETKLPKNSRSLNKDSMEAVCGIISAASKTDSQELHSLHNVLCQTYEDLANESKRRHFIGLKLADLLSAGRPTQTKVDTKLVEIAKSQNMVWSPPYLLPEERASHIEEILSGKARTGSIDLQRLRYFCKHGIPDSPSWLRSRSWSILLGCLSSDPNQWNGLKKKLHQDYLALAEPILLMAASDTIHGPDKLHIKDKALIQLTRDLESLPPSLRQALDTIDESHQMPSPTIDSNRQAITRRVALLLAGDSSPNPATRSQSIPSITLDVDEDIYFPPNTGSRPSTPTATLFKSSASCSNHILIRLLYIYVSLHASYALPHGPSSSLASIFATMLIVFYQGRDDKEAAFHSLELESEVFWAVEALLSDVRELTDEADEGDVWSRTFSRRVRWADKELWNHLTQVGLDPASPYYSAQWIPTLFTHALPLSDVLAIWDAMLSLPSSKNNDFNGENLHADFIYMAGTCMLIRSRLAISRSRGANALTTGLSTLWNGRNTEVHIPRTPSSYSPAASPTTPLSPMAAGFSSLQYNHLSGASNQAFLIGLKLLQEYDIEASGGVERLLDTTWIHWRRWKEERDRGIDPDEPDPKSPTDEMRAKAVGVGGNSFVASGFGRLKQLAWNGIGQYTATSDGTVHDSTHAMPPTTGPQLMLTAPSSSPRITTPGLGLRIRETVWKGIINQLDSPDSAEPSPYSSRPHTPVLVADEDAPRRSLEEDVESVLHHAQREDEPQRTQSEAGSWGWVNPDKWSNSDTAAALARTSTNLRVRALEAWSQRSQVNGGVQQDGLPEAPGEPQGRAGHSHNSSLTKTSDSVGSWSELFSTTGSFSFGLKKGGSDDGTDTSGRRASITEVFQTSVAAIRRASDDQSQKRYSPPPKPEAFRPARDSIFGFNFLPSEAPSRFMSSGSSEEARSSPPGKSVNPLQAALAALSSTTTARPSTPPSATKTHGPKPLLLNSSSLITPHTPRSRGPSPSPSPRPGSHFSVQSDTDETIVYNSSTKVPLRRKLPRSPRGDGLTPFRNLSVDDKSSDSKDTVSVAKTRSMSPRPRGFLVDHGEEASQASDSASPSSSSHGHTDDVGSISHGLHVRNRPSPLSLPTGDRNRDPEYWLNTPRVDDITPTEKANFESKEKSPGADELDDVYNDLLSSY